MVQNSDRSTAAASAAGAEMFANRLRKNLRHLGKWARREGVTCYRVYDADLPEYAVAVDLYEAWAHVQEYAAPPTVDPGARPVATHRRDGGDPGCRGNARRPRRPQGAPPPERRGAVRAAGGHRGGFTKSTRAACASW